MMKDHRPDLVFFANRDAIRVNNALSEIIIPVEWRKEEKSMAKSRQTLVQTNNAFKQERAIVLFPSGRIAYWNDGRLTERPWMATAIQMAKRYNVPIIPMNMKARNSGLFYLLAHRNHELRDMTVFHELLNKKNKNFEMTLGAPIDVSSLEGDVQDLTVTLQEHCEITLRDNALAGVIAAGGFWFYRMRDAGRAAGEVIDKAQRVKGAINRKRFRDKAAQSPFVTIDDPVLAAVTSVIAIAAECGTWNETTKSKLKDTFISVSNKEDLEEAVIYGEWAVKQTTEMSGALRHTGPILASMLSADQR
ncbi:hypothetical protein GQR58_026806 [Nymphon striatum]|nr:hypothetical protein GQR58_026806 [Nymphon striatum]